MLRRAIIVSSSSGFSGVVSRCWGRGALPAPVIPSVFPGDPSPFVPVTPVSVPIVQFCVPVGRKGSFCGVLFALVGWLVGLVSTYSYERDVNRHAQQVRARITWQVGSFLGCLCLGFILLLCSYVVVPVRGFKCSL